MDPTHLIPLLVPLLWGLGELIEAWRRWMERRRWPLQEIHPAIDFGNAGNWSGGPPRPGDDIIFPTTHEATRHIWTGGGTSCGPPKPRPEPIPHQIGEP